MSSNQDQRFTVADILNAANKHYDEGYLSTYFDGTTGRCKRGSGDTLAEFIVHELRESFEGRGTRQRKVAGAIRALERAKRDIQTAIAGLREL
jgi:hypothetical protein